MILDKMGAPQNRCYNKSMRLLENVFWSLWQCKWSIAKSITAGGGFRCDKKILTKN